MPLALSLADTLEKFGHHDRQRQLYRAVLPHTPTSKPFWTLARDREAQQDWDAAVQLYEQAIARFPNDAELRQALAAIEQQRKNWPRVIEHLTAACENGGDSASTYQRLGNAYRQQQQWAKAAIAYRELLQREPDAYWGHQGLGLALMRQEQWREAAAAFQRALDRDPQALRSRIQLGHALAQLGEWRACCRTVAVAIEERREALSLSPMGPWLKRFTGLDLNAPWPDDWESFTIAIEMAIDAGRYLGNDREKVDLVPIADAFFTHAIAQFPTREWHHYFYFRRMLIRFRNQNRLDELCDRFRTAIAEDPDARDAYLNLAAVEDFRDANQPAALAYATLLDRDAGFNVQLDNRDIPNFSDRLDPEFFIIGVQKGGTTSLHSYLCEHPQIESGAHKEIDFWSVEYERGLDWYRSQFPPHLDGPRRVTGEASNTYLDHPDAPARLHAVLPEAKIILVLRDPTERAISHYYQRYRDRNLIEPIEDFLRSELTFAHQHPPESVTHENYTTHMRGRAISRGLYSYFVKRWLDYFPRSSLLVFDSRELFSQTNSVVERIQTFIGLEPQSADSYPVLNPGTYRHISPELERDLRDFFRPTNRELEVLLDREFDWP